MNRSDAQRCIATILESRQPDDRRKAISRLAQTKYIKEQDSVDALAAVAVHDHSISVRRSALFALARSENEKACSVFVDLLKVEPRAQMTDATEGVREAAAIGLVKSIQTGCCNDAMEEKVVETAIAALGSDRSRNVRLAAAEVLGYFARKDVLHSLIIALEQRDFGVCYEAEKSLTRLTGRTYDHDPVAWREFLENNDDPFAEKGMVENQDSGKKWYKWW